MKSKIFNAQEVQAMLNGSKVMFREVIKPQPSGGCHFIFDKETNLASQIADYSTKSHMVGVYIGDSHSIYLECPYQVGQKIFCKETFAKVEVGAGMGYNTGEMIIYRAVDDYDVEWKPAQHMKQEHSRLTLLIKEIRVERLASISEEDAIAEGLPLSNEFKDRYYTPEGNYATAKIAFMRWWNATHKKPEEKFEANPWVWVVSFNVTEIG